MRSNHSVGRHRRPGPARALVTRTAVSTGAAVAAVLMAGGPATAATASTDGAAVSAPTAEPPCTGTPLDAIVGPAAGVDCNSNPEDDDPTDPGGPGTPDDGGGSPPAGGGAPGAPPISCTGSPLDAFTTCATGGHSERGGDRGDAVGEDTPSYGSGGSGEGDNPPAG